MTFEEARASFPVLDRLAYLNAGTNGPLARATVDAMNAQAMTDLTQGRSGPAYRANGLELRERVRGRLAEVAGVPAERVALTTSTTNGCNIVMSGLELVVGDEILTTDEEHFGLLGPVYTSGAAVRVAATRGLPPAEALDVLLAAVTSRTALLALSHVSWVTGNVLPIAELKAETGLPILVDGAQSAGAIDVDASPYDYYTLSGQKWLCGPDGTGGLVVADAESLRVAAPTYMSAERFDDDGVYEPKAGAARFDSGWIGSVSLAGLDAALGATPAWAHSRARETSARCRSLLAERYEVATAPDQSTLVSFRPEGDPAELVARLYDSGVVVREIPDSGLVRVSCGYWTSEDDLTRLVDALSG